MDFSKEIMDRQGYGNYERLDPALLPKVYIAYRTSLSEGTEIFHSNVRERWRAGDAEVVGAMKTWADYAERGRQALMAHDDETLDGLINANFDLRAKIFQLSHGNLEMVHAARRAGATSNFAGSGGAIVGTYKDDDMFHRLQSELQKTGVAVLKPRIR